MGLKFEDAIVSGVLTPISMAGIFTGKYCEKIKSRCLAEVLSKNGFTTLAFHSRYFWFNREFKYFYFNDYVWIDEEGYCSRYSKWKNL